MVDDALAHIFDDVVAESQEVLAHDFDALSNQDRGGHDGKEVECVQDDKVTQAGASDAPL